MSHNFTGLLTGLLTGGGVLAKGRPLGIITDPGYKLYEGDDCHCWPIGFTPKKLFVSVSGVKTGSLWTSANPASPNSIFIVEYSAACNWVWLRPDWEVVFTIQPMFSALQVTLRGIGFAFSSNMAGVCAGEYTNSLTYAGNYYYGGIASVSQREAV